MLVTVDTPIVGYHHNYVTDNGAKISEEQILTVCKSGIGQASQEYTRLYEHPYDDPKRYEGRTLDVLWSYCQQNDPCLVWYIHTKGASRTGPSFESCQLWRRDMEQVLLYDWSKVTAEFFADPELDCYGAFLPDPPDDRFYFPGNFWWATSEHIKRLPSPRKWAEEICGRTGENVRYGYEDWITLSAPADQKIKAGSKYLWTPDELSHKLRSQPRVR